MHATIQVGQDTIGRKRRSVSIMTAISDAVLTGESGLASAGATAGIFDSVVEVMPDDGIPVLNLPSRE